MMNILIAIAAGCAAALMFASLISGALISLVAVLSRAAAADGRSTRLGSGQRAGRRASPPAPGSASHSASPTFFAFILTVGLPGILARISGAAGTACGRPRRGMNGSSPAPADALEWYPLGRLLLWIAVFALLIDRRRAADARQRLRDRSRKAAPRRSARMRQRTRQPRRTPTPTRCWTRSRSSRLPPQRWSRC